MLARPFRAMPKGRLVTLLILFLLLEAAGGAGLYVNNRPAANAAAPRSTATPPGHRGQAALIIQNTPRTVILGHQETFSVQLKGLENVILVYTISYPDGSLDQEKVLTDRTGFSKKSFTIKYKPQHGNRDSVGINVSYGGRIQASTQFAVQLPTGKKKK